MGQAYSWGAFGEDVGGLFSGGGDGSLSFTNYEGGLATLDEGGYDSALTASSDLKTFVLKVVNFALGFLGLIAVLMIIYAGVTYVTSAGQDEKTGNAKKTITYAAVGLLIVLGSFAFVNTVIKAALVGEGGTGTKGQFGENYGKGFNAIAEEVKGIALDIYSGYVSLADMTEVFKNIKADSEKISLDRSSLPTKATITSFLQNTKGKLMDVRAKVGNLTEMESAINEKIRDIEKEIDKINNIKDETYNNEESYLKWEGGAIHFWNLDDSSGWDAFWNGTYEGATGDNVATAKGYTYLDGGIALLNEWDDYKSKGLDFKEVVPLLGKNYASQLETYLDRLIEINDMIKTITAVGGDTSDAANYFKIMLGTDSQVGVKYSEKYGNLLTAVKAWTLASSDIDAVATESLIPGLEAHSKYYTALLNLEFVKARLHADTVFGNAPLTVILDVGDSVDPAGGSIDFRNVIWDPAGTQAVNGVLSGVPSIDASGYLTVDGKPLSNGKQVPGDTTLILPNGDGVACDPIIDPKLSGIAATSRRCTFTAPGTYLAMVVVNSNDKTKYGPGISLLKIVASPPTTEIELKGITPSSPEGKWIMHYAEPPTTPPSEDYVGNINANKFVVISSEVEKLEFDASGTEAESFKWTFGNGEMTDWSSSLFKVGKEQFGSYDLGSYQVKLEVMNKAGVIDKKIFNLVVKNVDANVASLTASHTKIDEEGNVTANIKTPIVFDGSSSVASKGNKITNYAWDVYKLNEDKTLGELVNKLDDDKSGSAKKTYTYSFEEAGWYEIRLTIQGSTSDSTDKDTTEPGLMLKVVSKPPVSAFDYEIPEPTLPGTVYFTNESTDPDNKPDELEYTWYVDQPQKDIVGKSGVKNWAVLNGQVVNGTEIKGVQNPIIKFNTKGLYKVKLATHVKNMPATEELSEIEKEIEITDTLDVAWDTVKQKTAGKINEDFGFYLKSENGVGYEINFGDGETASGGTIPVEGIKHQYKQAGKYIVEVTVFDEEDEDNSIKRKIIIGGGDMPVASAKLLVNDTEVIDNTKPIEVIRTDKLIFSGDDSVNTDGTGKKLKYSWDFGDQKNSSLKEAQHSYSDLSPTDKGFYEAKLTVYDEDDATKTNQDTVQVNVCPAPPKYTYIEANIQGNKLITPAIVNINVYGVTDPDNGKIVKYRWWYFDLKNPEEEHGSNVTTKPTAQLLIGSYGDSEAEVEYGIGLEITDNDGLVYCNVETCRETMIASYKRYPTCEKLKALGERESSNNYPIVKVQNEKNTLPMAAFGANSTKGLTTDEFTFISKSSDPDGDKIIGYIWDFEGNGFSDNERVTTSEVKHTYAAKNMEGYDVKLKVIDSKGGESVSEVIKVYVDALGKAPVAAFKSTVLPGTNGQTIKFTDTSKPDESADAKLIKYTWDFDSNTDSDGDGNKTNDIDANVANPEHLFSVNGTYKTKLTVVDDQGNKDDVTNDLKIPLANPPKVTLKCELNNATVTCHDLSVADVASGAEIVSRIWDFDTTTNATKADLDKDGDKTNDEDSPDKDPTYVYEAGGLYKIKLTVKDDQGNISELFKDVTIDIAGGTSSVEADSANGTGSTPATNTASTGSGHLGLNTGIEPDDNKNETVTTTGVITTPIDKEPEIVVEKMIPSLLVTINEANGKTITNPIPDKDGIIYLTDQKQMATFNFTGSTGPIAYYVVDKNINYDSNGDGIRDNDEDYKTNLKGIYQTSFDRSIGDTHVMRLTVMDINGKKEVMTQTIKFK
ncbi:MAG: PKD domain-containing protein [Candidatus Gracilibacteria bacterium]